MKKILIYLSIYLSFIFCFIFGKYINTLAMGSFDNSIGTIPIQMDIDNYDNYNLFKPNSFYRDFNISFNETKSYNLTPYGIELITSNNYALNGVGVYFNLSDMSDKIIVGEIYTFSFDITYNNDFAYFKVGNEANGDLITCYSNSKCNYTSIVEDRYNYIIYGYGGNSNVINNAFTIDNLMIYKGKYEEKKVFVPYFEFGYNANINYTITGSSNNTVNYYFNDMTFTKNINGYSSGYLIENYYIPFTIDKNGYISLPNINFGISSISNNSNSYTYSLQLELTPVFSAYYKGQYTNNIYTNLNYMSNDLFFSGITFSSCNDLNCQNNINAANLSLDNPQILAVSEQNSNGNISNTNISTYFNSDIKNRNLFEYNNYLNVGFRIGDLGEDYNTMNGRNYNFAISSISSRIVDNQTTTTPLPNNPNTNDKYNECSAWYDIPCQLGNAVTYVIYEAPIISPIIEFFGSFIDLIGSLVTYIKWFDNLGIIFGVFIAILFIRMIILLVKGGNED